MDPSSGRNLAYALGTLALIVAIQWSRSDEKEQKRKDRAEDRSGDAELRAYNELLARQAERDQRQASRG